MNHSHHTLWVLKASGEREPFSIEKFEHSLHKAGASQPVIEAILAKVKKKLRRGNMRTTDLYHLAFSLLHRYERMTASRYSLKKAIMELGPTGHPFEKLVGEIVKKQGFSVEVGVIVPGFCVTHEVDVVAHKDDRHMLVECKFHNMRGVKSDVKVALYVHARFQDIEKKRAQEGKDDQKFHEAWVVTNTKLTIDAVRYAACAGMRAIGWDYPHGSSLQQMLESSGLYPLTCLTTLKDFQKKQLLGHGFVTCRELLETSAALEMLRLRSWQLQKVQAEIKELCRL